MKKSFKILTLVLSLALLCGALVVAVLADEPAELTGVDVCFTTDFTGATSGTSDPGQTNIVTDFTVDNKGSGIAKVVTDKQGNSYFVYDYEGDDRVAGATNYSYTAPKSGAAWGTVTSLDTFKDYYYINNKYYVADMDVYFPNGVPNGLASFYFYNYVPTETVVTDDKGNVVKDEQGNPKTTWSNATEPSDKAFQWKFKNKADGGVEVLTTSGKTYDLLDGAWTHLTAFVTYEIDGDNFYIITYTAINGQIVDVAKVKLDNKANTPDPHAWWPKTVRFDFNNKDTAGREMDIDNLTIRKLTKEYNGNLDEIIAQGIGASTATWESDLYKNGEKTPFTTAAASVNGKEYDHLQRAVAAAKEGDEITLLANVNSVVNIDKALTIKCGDYTMVKPTLVPGYIGDYAEGTTDYVIEATQDSIAILFEACNCAECEKSPDASHPGNVIIEDAYRDNDIFNFYVNAGKSLDWSLNLGTVSYKLTGWVDENGKNYKTGDVVTEEMVEEGALILYPVIETAYATVEYIKGGVVAYASGDRAFATAIANADADTTVKLIADSKCVATGIDISKKITIDLNGYMLQAVTTADQLTAKANLFSVNHTDFTVVGEQEGSALINFWVNKDNVNDDGSRNESAAVFQNAQTFSLSSKAGTVTIKGENIYVNCAQLARINSSGKTIKLEGGTYAKDGVGDGYGYIYGASKVGNCTIEVKDAIINANGFISFYDTAGSKVTIDNSAVICGQGNFYNTANAYAETTITNSYIACNLSSTNGTAVVGAGNYIRNSSNWTDSVTYTPGVIVVAANEKVTHTFPKTIPMADLKDGKYVVYDSCFEVFEGKLEATYIEYTKTAIAVNFKDGETVLATVYGDPGTKVVGPTNGEAAFSVANGWVIATPAYAYTIPAGTTAVSVDVDVKDITETGYIYTAGTPELYLNYRLSDNLATNLYRPKVLPEGIELVNTILNGSNSGRSWTGNWVVNGVECYSTQGWPIAWDADDDKPAWELIYTYEGTTLSYTVKANVVDYAKKVAAKYESDAVKMKQIVALLQYVETANKLKGDTINNGLSEYLKSLKDSGITLDAIAEETYDLSAISTYISGASVGINSGRGGSIKFTLTDAGKAEGITYKIIGSVNDNAEIPTELKNGYLATDNAHIPTMGAHKFTIVVYSAGEEVARADYSLAAYATATELTGDELAMAEALYNLSKIGNQTN